MAQLPVLWRVIGKIIPTDVPSVRGYIEMLHDAGAKVYGCKMTVDMFGIKKEDFLPQVECVVTAGDFMDMTKGAQIIFI